MVDCGGGTVDISSFTVVSVAPARLDQLGKAIGGSWGSTKVDEQFEGYLKVRCWKGRSPRSQETGENKTLAAATNPLPGPFSRVVLNVRKPDLFGRKAALGSGDSLGCSLYACNSPVPLVTSHLQDFIESVAEDAGARSLDTFFASSAMYRILQVTSKRVNVNPQFGSGTLLALPYLGGFACVGQGFGVALPFATCNRRVPPLCACVPKRFLPTAVSNMGASFDRNAVGSTREPVVQ